MLKTTRRKIVSVNSAEMIAVIDNYNATIINKNNIEIEKRDNKVSIEKLYAKIKASQYCSLVRHKRKSASMKKRKT